MTSLSGLLRDRVCILRSSVWSGLFDRFGVSLTFCCRCVFVRIRVSGVSRGSLWSEQQEAWVRLVEFSLEARNGDKAS